MKGATTTGKAKRSFGPADENAQATGRGKDGLSSAADHSNEGKTDDIDKQQRTQR